MTVVSCFLCQKTIPARQRVYLKVTEEPLLSIRDTFLRNGERNDQDLCRFFERYGTVCCKTGCHPFLKRVVNLKKELSKCEDQIEDSVGQLLDSQSQRNIATNPESPGHQSNTTSPAGCSYSPRRTLFRSPLRTRALQQETATNSPSVFVSPGNIVILVSQLL